MILYGTDPSFRLYHGVISSLIIASGVRQSTLSFGFSAAANHPDGPDRSLAEPREGALPGGHEGQLSQAQPRSGLGRHRGGSPRHLPQARRDIRHHRAVIAG